MLSEFLILKLDGKNLGFGATKTDVRTAILELSDDDVDTIVVERLHSLPRLAPTLDITAEFARAWALDLRPNDPVPAFLRHHAVRSGVAA